VAGEGKEGSINLQGTREKREGKEERGRFLFRVARKSFFIGQKEGGLKRTEGKRSFQESGRGGKSHNRPTRKKDRAPKSRW